MIITQDFKSEQSRNRTAYVDGPRLLAKIGATHARFALETAPGVFRTARCFTYESIDDIAPLLHTYLAGNQGIPLRHAALAIARSVRLAQQGGFNGVQGVSTDALRLELGLQTLLLVDEFDALTMALPYLSEANLVRVGGGTPIVNGVLAAIGVYTGIDAATGMAAAGLVPTVNGFLAIGNKGGHVDFAPSDERELFILQYAQRYWPHVTNERLISAAGIEMIFRALGERNCLVVADESAQQIIVRALNDKDALCLEALDVFCCVLGSVSANLAATLGAVGGVFIDCCITPQFIEWLTGSQFRTRFEAKGRISKYVAQIPTYLIVTQDVAFHGLTAMLSEHLRGGRGTNTLLERVLHLQRVSPPAAQRVATSVLEQPYRILQMPIGEIARMAHVSEPTVIRFCRTLGFFGIREFKLKLAGGLSGSCPVRHSQVFGGDSVHTVSDKVINNTASAILAMRGQLDTQSIGQAINLICKANRIDFYAAGAAGVAAVDGQYKFLRQRLRVPTAIYSESYQFEPASERLKPGDVVIAIATTDQEPALLAAVATARAAGVDVVAIAASKSPLGKKATVCLGVNHLEGHGESPVFLPMISRLLQLLLIDILSVGISVYAQNPARVDAGESQYEYPLISHLEL